MAARTAVWIHTLAAGRMPCRWADQKCGCVATASCESSSGARLGINRIRVSNQPAPRDGTPRNVSRGGAPNTHTEVLILIALLGIGAVMGGRMASFRQNT